MNKPQFVIAAPTSNAGKTTLTLGLLRALYNRGQRIHPFKCGPDYIDPKFHQLAAKHLSRNLDLYMMDDGELESCYSRHIQSADVACIEGVMGLFDGARKAAGSTAEIAKKLQLPVVLIVNAKAVAYSVAPLLYGFQNFDSEVEIAGVIFNQVNTESHYQFLKDACDDVGVTALGYLPWIDKIEIPSRHLGLSIANLSTYEPTIELIARQLEKTVDIDLLLKLTNRPSQEVVNPPTEASWPSLKIAIAQDEAFNFTYQQNLETLEAMGEVKFFSPLHDDALPEADLIYLPGGYPECYLEQLSANTKMLESIKNYATNHGRIIAECGGLMYLGQSIINGEGLTFSMSGVFDFNTSMEHSKLSLGYRKLPLEHGCLKGHEFHYSTIFNDQDTAFTGGLLSARDLPVNTKIYRHKGVLASYVHFYLGSVQHVNQLLNLTITTIQT
ncbi:cobyrinate a,c-diamide synthase [Fulvivirga kasyanovii]|uniref:Cobyrinate a,c-diamide synthase n=1 Tax=Fulvivirga kasyanovii TaxID=396812 RepID=A0ABW9RQN6_9BACT|nr:cobyrinate a,c-diamide synthase [Fulvivirga kasyanovii]MTI26489.1 cobyrinate a,c-diamide synthase [Fulvivirga kasyanovii]